MTTRGEDSDDESSGFNSINGTLDLVLNLGAAIASCKPSSTTPVENSKDESTGFDNNIQSRGMLLNFGAMAASHEPSSTTRMGKRNRWPGTDTCTTRYQESVEEILQEPTSFPAKLSSRLAPRVQAAYRLVARTRIEAGDAEGVDVLRSQFTLSMTVATGESDHKGATFLRTVECDELHTNKDKEIVVGVISSNLEEKSLKFKLWLMNKKARVVGQPKPEPTNVYVLLGGWVGFARENELEENDRVQLWSFRVNDKTHHDSLKFAIVKLEGNDVDREGDDAEAVAQPA